MVRAFALDELATSGSTLTRSLHRPSSLYTGSAADGLLSRTRALAAFAGPSAVPAALAPASGQAPSILERPVSVSLDPAAATDAASASLNNDNGNRVDAQAEALVRSLANSIGSPDRALQADLDTPSPLKIGSPYQGYEFPPIQRLRVANKV